MKVNILEAHDRFKEFTKQADYISEGCQECIQNRPKEFGNCPFYIFAHKRELAIDERIAMYNSDIQTSLVNIAYLRKYRDLRQVPTARLIWSARLTKPRAQENSMLFKAYPPGDNIKVMWMIPDSALFGQYNKDDVVENHSIKESIHDFLNNKQKLEKKEEDDVSDSIVDVIYSEIADNARRLNYMNKGLILDYKI